MPSERRTSSRADENASRRLADAMPIIVWTNANDGRTTYLNATWTAYTGASFEESLDADVRSFIHPDDRAAVERTAADAQARGTEGFQAFYRLRGKDGVYRWHFARVIPLAREESGAVRTWIGTAMDVDETRKHEAERSVLVEAGRVLGASLDTKTTLTDVARLVVPNLSDWCAIDLLDDAGKLERLAVAHVDPSKVALAWELWARVPPQPSDAGGAYEVLRSGRPQVQREDPDPMLAEAIADPELLALFRSLGLRSWIVMPLVARDRALGTLTLVWSESRRTYDDHDVAFATELAQRIAIAVDNARLYETATRARVAAEALAADVVEQTRVAREALVTMRAERDEALARLRERDGEAT